MIPSAATAIHGISDMLVWCICRLRDIGEQRFIITPTSFPKGVAMFPPVGPMPCTLMFASAVEQMGKCVFDIVLHDAYICSLYLTIPRTKKGHVSAKCSHSGLTGSHCIARVSQGDPLYPTRSTPHAVI